VTGRVFRRSLDPDLPVAVEAHGSTIRDAAGREYLDAAGGAIVVNVGHGRASIARVLGEQLGRLAYAHGSAFTNEPLEAYAAEIGPRLPVDDPAIYPVSGGSEAIETALKLARAYHLARGETDRWIVISRWGSYHGNTLGALDLSGRRPLRRPYEGWLGRFQHVSTPYPYRDGEPGAQALGAGADLAAELERTIEAAGPGTVAAFVAEPIVGATLAAAVPPDDYWPLVAEVCRRYGVLLIADEVMTGFGRTGRWFGLDHWGVRADLLVAAKGATSGYWPFGFVAASGAIHDAVVSGERLADLFHERLAPHPHLGEIRGRGLMVGLELVADRETRAPFPRAEKITERVVRAARDRGVLVYSGTGNANGVDGDQILLGPPFVVTDDELTRIADVVGEAVEAATAEVAAG
jgi:adenosylmethionine-8-amino-7-oxononanoate aminotransferase